jgi:hypothetical protein
MLLCLTAAGGCMSQQPRVVSMDRDTGSGIVAIPSGSDTWPFYYRREALALIERQVGPHYKIVSEGDVPVTQNAQVTNTEQTSNPRNPNQPGQQTSSGFFWQQNTTEYRITFVKMAAPPAGTNPNNRTPPIGGTQVGGTGGGQGLTPIGGVGTGAANGMVPSVLPNNNNGSVNPAGAGARWPGSNN